MNGQVDELRERLDQLEERVTKEANLAGESSRASAAAGGRRKNKKELSRQEVLELRATKERARRARRLKAKGVG